jgi:glycosyltransferase involved in cell wall biosynthesis
VRRSRVVPLRVLHVAQPAHAGVPRVAGDFVADQVPRGWDVVAACPEASDLERFARAAGARHVRWEAAREPGPASARETAALGRIVARVAPDVVHLHSAKAGLAGRLAIRGRRPTVFQPHSWSFEAARGRQQALAVRWERFAARWADALVCVSEDERVRGRALGIRARWAVLPNGVDVDRLAPAGAAERAAARERLGLADGPVAVVVGRICEQKGQAEIVGLWPRVRALVPGARLILVGDGPDRAALSDPAGGVVTVGDREDVGEWLAAADVAAIPSRWEAGLTLAAMEAMARARPVVGYDVAGMREGLSDGGAVVAVGDGAALVDAIARRLGDPGLAELEGAAARRRVAERYDVRETTAAVARLYDAVLARRDGSRERTSSTAKRRSSGATSRSTSSKTAT